MVKSHAFLFDHKFPHTKRILCPNTYSLSFSKTNQMFKHIFYLINANFRLAQSARTDGAFGAMNRILESVNINQSITPHHIDFS